MKSSFIITVVAVATLGQATWPSPLTALNLTTHSPSSHRPLETISLPSVPSARGPSSSRQTVEGHSLSTQSSGSEVSASSHPATTHGSSSHRRVVHHTHPPPPVTYNLSAHSFVLSNTHYSLPTTTHGSSSHRRIVYHTLPPPPATYNFSSHSSAVSHSHSSLSAAHNSSSSPPTTIIPSSQPFAANFSVVEVSPSATPCVCHGGHDDPSCCLEKTRWETITRLVLIAVPTTVVDYDGKTRTVTEDRLSTIITTATFIDHKTQTVYKWPSPTAWDPSHRPIRPHPSVALNTYKKPGPTPWDLPRKPHGAVRPYPPEDKTKHHKAHGTVGPHPPEDKKKHHKADGAVRPYPPGDKKHYKPTYTISVFGPETTCPAGFTCQPDDKYIGKKLAVREANVPWPAPPGCANHCVGGRGCWTECDKPHQQNPSRICPEGYSCQREKKLVPAQDPEPPQQQRPHKELPAPNQQPAPPAAYPEPRRIPAPMPPSPPSILPQPVQPPPVSPPAAFSPPTVLPPAVEQSPPAAPSPVVQSPATPVQSSTHMGSGPDFPTARPHHCPSGKHPCPPRHTNGTVGAPETVTKADAGLFTPAAIMAMIFAGGLGIIIA